MDYIVERRNPAAWWAFWIGLFGLVTMPIPLFIGFFIGGGSSLLAALIGVIALIKGISRDGKGVVPLVFAAIFIGLTWLGISNGGGIIW